MKQQKFLLMNQKKIQIPYQTYEKFTHKFYIKFKKPSGNLQVMMFSREFCRQSIMLWRKFTFI